MTIDPLTISCAYCGSKGEKHESVEYGMEISCLACGVTVYVDDWITGGINALAGKLMKENIFVELHLPYIKPQWVWSVDRRKYIHKRFDTFEEAVFDAWKSVENRCL